MENQSSTIKHSSFRVGVTGGIGSGKSTVCRIFHEALGIPIFYADIWAKKLINYDPALRKGIIDLFGSEAYTPDGAYNRPYVAKIAFADPAKLAALNALVHPAVEAESLDWHQHQTELGCPYTLKEAALLVESGGYKHLDFMIVVTAPEALRIQRVMDRDRLTEEEVRARMRGQLPEEDKLKLADFILINDGLQMLLPQVWEIHQAILGH
ncbi:MAG: dephospho-CoA kinase [Saprospiraceae bacterium]